ncbi:MAG: DoxX-like family protein [Phycisphaeraceae bacterium]
MRLTAFTTITTDAANLYRLTQTPHEHRRWDLRFSEITYLPRKNDTEPQRFRYATRIGFGMSVQGWGQTVGHPGRRGSSLKFGSEDRKSLIREGSGCWIYDTAPDGGHVALSTVYDYHVRFGWLGRTIDAVVFRPLMIGATRWSFDRLRLWIERDVSPEVLLRLWMVKVVARVVLGLIWIIEGIVPKLLFVAPGEVDVVARSGLYWPTPMLFLHGLGVIEVLGGLWLLWGKAERVAVASATAAMALLVAMVVLTEPSCLIDPMGGIRKCLALLPCAMVVWVLSPMTPRADRAARKGSLR